MTNSPDEIAEEFALWLENAGFDKDVSALVAGILDIRSGFEEIEKQLLPALVKLDPSQKDDILTLVVDLWLKSEHIAKHAEDLRDITAEIRQYFDAPSK